MTKASDIGQIMKAEHISILGLTGTDWKSEAEMNAFINDLPPDILCIGAAGPDPDMPRGTTGVALLVQNDPTIPVELSQVEKGPSNRWIAAKILREDKASIRIMVIYAPPGELPKSKQPRKQIIEDIHKWTSKQKDY